jgi:hypothetical protein
MQRVASAAAAAMLGAVVVQPAGAEASWPGLNGGVLLTQHVPAGAVIAGPRAPATVGALYTLAGGGRRPAASGVRATDAEISAYAVAATPAGTLLMSDVERVFSVGRDGRLKLFAGGARFGPPAGDGGPAARASLGGVDDLATGPDGSVYILDADYSTIRRVAPDGMISTAAGQAHTGLEAAAGGDGGPGAAVSAAWNRRDVGRRVADRRPM